MMYNEIIYLLCREHSYQFSTVNALVLATLLDVPYLFTMIIFNSSKHVQISVRFYLDLKEIFYRVQNIIEE